MKSTTDQKISQLGADDISDRVEDLDSVKLFGVNIGEMTEFKPGVGETMPPMSVDLRLYELNFGTKLVISRICDAHNLRVTVPDHLQSGGPNVTVRLVPDS